jgi:hypothetical protein
VESGSDFFPIDSIGTVGGYALGYQHGVGIVSATRKIPLVGERANIGDDARKSVDLAYGVSAGGSFPTCELIDITKYESPAKFNVAWN